MSKSDEIQKLYVIVDQDAGVVAYKSANDWYPLFCSSETTLQAMKKIAVTLKIDNPKLRLKILEFSHRRELEEI